MIVKVCKKFQSDLQNFQFVVKANILDNGDLDISVSSTYGLTYYTDNISKLTEVPKEVTELMYTAQKDVVAEFGRRKLCPWCPLIVIVIVGAALVTLALAACPD